MKLVYIDESGNTGLRSDDVFQPYHLVSGLIIDEKMIRTIENEIRLLAFKYFGLDSKNTDFEFHGYEIDKGKGYFSKLKVTDRAELLRQLLEVIKVNELPVIYVIVDKKQCAFAIKYLHPHQIAFMGLIQRIEEYLAKEDSFGLLVADENPDIEKRLLSDLEHYKTINLDVPVSFNRTGFNISSGFNQINRIVDSIHFVKSSTNRLIQLADIVSYVLLRGIKAQNKLQERYNNQNELIKAEFSFLQWVEKYATFKEQIDLNNYKMISSQSRGLTAKYEEIVK